MTSPLPVEIEPEETLLRSLRKGDVNRQTMSVKPGSLKPGTGGRTELSMIRLAIGAEEARKAAIEHVHGAEFWGFGSARVSVLSEHVQSIEDARDGTFLGHANMDLGFTVPAGPPNTPPDMTEVYEKCMSELVLIAGTLRVVSDRAATATWSDDDLEADAGGTVTSSNRESSEAEGI